MFMLWPFKIAMRLIELIFSAMVIYVIVSCVQVVMASSLPTATSRYSPASAIVVIGAAVANNAPSADLQARIDEAMKLYGAHLATKIFVTGTSPLGGPNLADSEKALFEQAGVPAASITPIVGGDTAAQLATAAVALGSSRSAIIVTDALHAFFTAKVAAHEGIRAQIAPAIGSKGSPWRHIGTILDQGSAIALGRIVGFQRIPWA